MKTLLNINVVAIIMKSSFLFLLSVELYIVYHVQAAAFAVVRVPQRQPLPRRYPMVSSLARSTAFTSVGVSSMSSSHAVAAVALEPEPPGGIELQPIGTTVTANSRVKQLTILDDRPDDDVVGGGVPSASKKKNNNNERRPIAPAFSFWMTTSADGKLIQEIRQTILKDASKKANFPGFRKVIFWISLLESRG
jgi:hypothetical protein